MMQSAITIPDPLSSDIISFNPGLFLGMGLCESCALQKENNILRSERAYWQAMHEKAKEREAKLIEESNIQKARIKKLEGMLFGRSSEQVNGGTEGSEKEDKSKKKKRGQREGEPGHGRRHHDDLPVVDEVYDLPETCCPHCQKPYARFFKDEESEVVEIEVSGHIRRIRRKSYKPSCTCPHLPAIITAKGPEKLLPKSIYGDSVWIEILLNKFYFFNPTYRLIRNLETIGLSMPQGSLTDGLQRLAPLFDPIYNAIVARNQEESHLHADETSWMVFSPVEGKVGYKWYLWVFKARESVVFILDSSRSASVPDAHLATAANLVLSVDRYSAYKLVAKHSDGQIVLAYCWAHVRRDFLAVGKGYPDLEGWAMEWVTAIGNLYYLNEQRLIEAEVSKQEQADAALKAALMEMADKREQELVKPRHSACEKVLNSLKNHWDGLTVFVENPAIPMDNNAAERALRGPVVGRNNFYGSGAVWSGKLAAVMFTIFQTLALWGINPRAWLQVYFRACAANRGQAPAEIAAFLPWEMESERLKKLCKPPDRHDSS